MTAMSKARVLTYVRVHIFIGHLGVVAGQLVMLGYDALNPCHALDVAAFVSRSQRMRFVVARAGGSEGCLAAVCNEFDAYKSCLPSTN
jgi:hypothetical protein